MKKNMAILIASALVFSGCGGDSVPVSGTVTIDGKPVANILVMFSPKAQGEDHFPGPFSTGMTNEDGKFNLKTRDGATGAVAGSHSVGFRWGDISPMELMFLNEQLSAAEMAEDPKAARAEIQKKIEETKKKIAERPSFKENVERTFEVPAGGTENADFELGTK